MIKDIGTRKEYPIKVIQFGEGNFLRAFVDWMIQKMNDKDLFGGQVAIVQPLDQGLIHYLEEQNCRYTHIMKGLKDGEPYEEHYINDSIGTTVNPYKEFDRYLELASVETANIIISNTTEAGIEFKESDSLDGGANVTYPGKLTRLMHKRFELTEGNMDKGYILMPCELIDNNADKLKEAVLFYVELWELGDEFRNWVINANTFCNTLVDRIVTGYPKDNIEEVYEKIGYKDKLVVESELFNLWVVQGDEKVSEAFPAAEAGCNFLVVDDVTPFKKRKVRILNGAHTSLVPVGYLYGKDTVRESLDDPVLEAYLEKTLFEEIIPTLELPKEALETFANEVIMRFKNPFIKHYLIDIALNSMSKYRTRVLPSLKGYYEKNGELPKGLVAALAALIVFYRGQYDDKEIVVRDSKGVLDLYKNLWDSYDGSPESIHGLVKEVLAYETNWYSDLNDLPGLTEQVASYARIILKNGMGSLLDSINGVV